jgi:hypothetical protein
LLINVAFLSKDGIKCDKLRGKNMLSHEIYLPEAQFRRVLQVFLCNSPPNHLGISKGNYYGRAWKLKG